MITNPRFFIGTVVDDDDPVKISRVRVRIFGEHDTLPRPLWSELPWSTVMFPSNTAGMESDGMSLGLIRGSTVFGLYINESDTIILGCIQSGTGEDFDDHYSWWDARGMANTKFDKDGNMIIDPMSHAPLARKKRAASLREKAKALRKAGDEYGALDLEYQANVVDYSYVESVGDKLEAAAIRRLRKGKGKK